MPSFGYINFGRYLVADICFAELDFGCCAARFWIAGLYHKFLYHSEEELAVVVFVLHKIDKVGSVKGSLFEKDYFYVAAIGLNHYILVFVGAVIIQLLYAEFALFALFCVGTATGCKGEHCCCYDKQF